MLLALDFFGIGQLAAGSDGTVLRLDVNGIRSDRLSPADTRR